MTVFGASAVSSAEAIVPPPSREMMFATSVALSLLPMPEAKSA